MILAPVASLAGVLFRGDLDTVEFRTVRGEVVEVVSEGVYRHDADGIVGEGIDWDLATLLLVVPASLVGLRFLWQGSPRAALALSALAVLMASLDLASLPSRVGAGFPHRAVVGYGVLVVLMLSRMWLPTRANARPRTSWQEA